MHGMATRGRPPAPDGAQTPAQRKAAQRERDRAALWAPGVSIDTLPTTALVESLLRLIAEDRPGTLGAVLAEIGRRGGVTVTIKNRALGTGRRVRGG